jgi:hypothetical protein
MLNGAAHFSMGVLSRRISRCLIFKRASASYQIMTQHRILYVGLNLALLRSLQAALTDCKVVRSPGGSDARLLIGSDIKYSLLLFDDEPLNTTGAGLKCFACSLKHRQQTPVIIYQESDDYNLVIETVIRELSKN